jgi:hypothetical protein
MKVLGLVGVAAAIGLAGCRHATRGSMSTSAAIVLRENATITEQTAGHELSSYLERVSGNQFPVVGESSAPGVGARIFVGATTFAADNGVGPGALPAEEWVIRSVGGDLILAGGESRGTLYAVYDFLENVVGVHWWNPWEEHVPREKGVRLGGHDRCGKPVIGYRDIHMIYGNDGGRFSAHNRLNREGDRRIEKEYGGCMDYGPPYHVHTFYRYFPPKEYFSRKPEYFSLIDGERRAERHQLCLTNHELRDLFVEKLKQYVESARRDAEERGVPPPKVFDISQNDWDGACQCANCQRIAKAEGSEAGPLFDFLNYIADAIREDYPDISIGTLAYQYTQGPPKTIRPRDNIAIRLCDTTSNFTKPITAPENKRFRDILVSWSKVAKNLRIWDYAVTYADPRGLPFPSVNTYQADFQFYAEHNVQGVFTELEYPVIADMRDLKVWMMMKLLEDPYRDYDELLRTFTDGFYGPGGAYIREYLDLLEVACEHKGSYVSMGTSASGMGYLDYAFIAEAQRLFGQAEEAVAGDPVLLRRVRHARLSLDRATIIRFKHLARDWQMDGNDPGTFPLDRDAVIRRCRQTWLEQIEMRIPEGKRDAEIASMESELTKYAGLPVFVPLPEKFRNLPKGTVFDFTADMTRNWKDIVKVVKDPETEGGITNRLEFPVRTDAAYHQLKKYQLPMPWGLYQPSTKTFVTSSNITTEDVPGPGYHWYRMGQHKIKPSYYMYFFWSWIIQLDIDSAFDPGNRGAEFEIWARIKFEGPAFPHGKATDKDAICVERVVLVRK